jgi:hypothetical protein
MNLDSLARRIQELQAEVHQGAIATTTPAGERAWIKDSGIEVIRLFNEIVMRQTDEACYPPLDSFSEGLRVKIYLWSRAELDESCGALACLAKQKCREIMGLEQRL